MSGSSTDRHHSPFPNIVGGHDTELARALARTAGAAGAGTKEFEFDDVGVWNSGSSPTVRSVVMARVCPSGSSAQRCGSTTIAPRVGTPMAVQQHPTPPPCRWAGARPRGARVRRGPLFRALARCTQRDYRGKLATASLVHATRSGALGLILYDVTTLHSEGRERGCAAQGSA